MTDLLSPKELAEAIGASESSVKRWVDGGAIPASRTLGGHRRIASRDAIAYIRSRGLAVVRPEILGLSPLAVDATGPTTVMDCLQEGRGADLLAALQGRFLAGESIADLCDGALRTSLTRMGELWREREDGILIEHRATAICGGALHRLQALLPEPAIDAPAAVGGACSGDASHLPSLMVSTVLMEAGFRTVDLGPDTPESVLVHAVASHAPRLVWLSINHVENPPRVEAELRRLIGLVEERRVPLVLGGRGVGQVDVPRSARTLVAGGLAELRAFAVGVRA